MDVFNRLSLKAEKNWHQNSGAKRSDSISGLERAEVDEFVGQYARRVAVAYPARSDGRTVMPFRRVFCVATRPAG